MASHIAEAELILRAKAGEQEAWRQLYEQYAPAIYRYIYFRVDDVQLAEDLLADVFVRMFEGLHRYEDRGWPLSAWLYRIAHDRAVDSLRRRAYRQQVPLEAWNESVDGPEQSVGMRLAFEEVSGVLNELTDEQRQVIQLRFLEELSIQAVAQQLGRTEGSVKALQHRGLQALARRLQPTAP
jgi:RNA polymerase sigma-70 factor (ECF subfamily)